MGKGSALKVPVAPAVTGTLAPRKGDACSAGAANKDPLFNSHELDLSVLPDSSYHDDILSEAGPEGQGLLYDSIGGSYGANPFNGGFADFTAAFLPEQPLGGSAAAAVTNPPAPFGSLEVDALFTMPRGAATADGYMVLPCTPDSPPSGTCAGVSPWSSPLRAPGSPAAALACSPRAPTLQQRAQQQHGGVAALPGKQAPAASAQRGIEAPDVVSVLGRSTVETSFATTGAEELRLVYSCAPKRKVELEPAYESEDSDKSVLTADAFPVESLAAPLYSSAAEVEVAFDSMATQQATPDGEIVTISPTLWRGQSPPFRLHASVGLHSTRATAAEAPLTWYGTMNPRVITTGQPKRSATRGAGNRWAEAYVEPPITRSSRGSGARAPKVPKVEVEDLPAVPSSRDLILQEVWLLQRGATGKMQGAHCATGPFVSTTIAGKDAPAWSGDDWSVDVAALVAAPTGDTFWLRAPGRAVQQHV